MNIIKIVFLLVISQVFICSAKADTTRRPAGYVTSVVSQEKDGKQDVVLVREGQDIEVQIWTPLFDGDTLKVSGAGSVTIESLKDKRIVITAQSSPHQITGQLSNTGRLTRISAMMGELFKAKPRTASVTISCVKLFP